MLRERKKSASLYAVSTDAGRPFPPSSAGSVGWYSQTNDELDRFASVAASGAGEAAGGVGGERRSGAPRQTGGDPPRGDRPPRARPPADRRRPWRRQDDARARARPLDRRDLSSHPVHERPPAVGRARRFGPRPEVGRVRVPAAARVREPRPRRRDQPHAAAHAERAARGDERRARCPSTGGPTRSTRRSW